MPEKQSAFHLNRRNFLKGFGVGSVLSSIGVGASLQGGLDALEPSIGALDPLPGLDPIPPKESLRAFADLNIRSLTDFAKLPWFEHGADGELHLSEGADVPPIIDTHTHLGWAQGFGPSIDMQRQCEMEYFFDFNRDQDPLFDQDHPNSDESSLMTWNIIQMLFTTPEINQCQTAANLSAEMDRMGYQHAVLLPIEIPFISKHTRDTLAASTLDERFVPLGAIYPVFWGANKEASLKEQCDKHRIQGIKFHPEFQMLSPDRNPSMRLFEYCAANDILVYAHVGYTGSELRFMRKKSTPDLFIPALEAFPNLRIVLAHTGVRLIDETLSVARQFEDQVWLDISGQPVPNILYILERFNQQKILYGSDWPFYPLAAMLARTLVATEGCDQLRENLLNANAKRLFTNLA